MRRGSVAAEPKAKPEAATTLFSIDDERGCRGAASHGTRRINIDGVLGNRHAGRRPDLER